MFNNQRRILWGSLFFATTIGCGDGGSSKGGSPDGRVTPRPDATATPDAPVTPPPDAPVVEPDAAQPDAMPVDTDEDGVADASDNCPAVSNAQQLDQDTDGVGDLCDTEAVNVAGLYLFVPAGTTLELSGAHCFESVFIAGTVMLPDTEEGTALRLSAAEIDVSGVIDGIGAGAAGGLQNSVGLGGHQALGAGGGCGGGQGAAVGQGGGGGGHGGAGGRTSDANPYGNECNSCDAPSVAHCRPLGGPEIGAAADDSALVGGGGGAAGNSSSCVDAAPGGAGGGAVVLQGESIHVTGAIRVAGITPDPILSPMCGDPYRPGGGGGAGGSIVLAAPAIALSATAELNAGGAAGGNSLGSTSEGWISTWGWAGGGGAGGRVKLFGTVTDSGASIVTTGGAGGLQALPADTDSFAGESGSSGTSHSDAVVPPALAFSVCPT